VTPYAVGLTGGIGSGKSVVARLFVERGVAVIDSDAISHELTAPAGASIDSIRETFSADMIRADGGLDRERMRRLVFADQSARRRLEAILHPLIREESARRLTNAKSAYAVCVVPLLVEQGVDRGRFQRVLVIDCSENEQISRVMRRSGLAEIEVRRILAAQATREARLAAADDVIDNSGPPDALGGQVARLHEKYLTLAAKPRTAS
jgi:dephospho-CoA kinase